MPAEDRDPEIRDPEVRDPDIRKLVDLVARLRAPDGCPWDREQTIDDLRAYVVEEAHEVAAAISSGERAELAGELGDLLFQIVFACRLGAEEGAFDLGDVIDRVHAKMVERHPHVFGAERLADADAVRRSWERAKLARKAAAPSSGAAPSLLDGVPASLPALVAAYRMTQKAAGVGFDWPDAASVAAKVREELGELEDALAGGHSPESVREEVGDLLFAVANLARHLGADPEAALAACNQKFRRRLAAVEADLDREGRTLADATLAEMDALWDEAKRRERRRDPA
ncbi:MAG TPA: nucleoside triphosphate pyrophosphohydrolase [Thermoanaerobaculia bacterium]|jgi:MazG family protein